ncbi:glycosyl transferase [Marinicauda salina]|uniref:Glycosyl transferase n=1 Tax=Marinicauda salina TaxID=2135793 RepID=A0A2U2BQV4_9PROT|nr:glycosyltransferase family 39 protein [Marinicauda salina]PWE16392.1 glycosyl transferase [Marinicauda salina]
MTTVAPSAGTRLDAPQPRLLAAGVVLAGLLALRLVAISIDPNSLYADETQYWIWSRDLDWGYFSKPPMIAWIIAATTGVFGNADWAVRLAAPFLHTATAAFLGLTAARLFGPRAGMWTAIGWATLPAVWLSASVISTDAVLMVFWSAGLYALVRLREGGGLGWGAALGVAAGLGFLSKYAIIYFLLGTGLALVVDAPARRALLSLRGLTAAAVFGAIVAPNVIWNASHDFATVSHTAANANWGAQLFNFDELGQFVGDQLAVFGPLFFPVLVAAMVAAARGEAGQAARPRLMLALYSAPALAIVAVQAFISRAHANWAASAYGAGLVLVMAFLLDGPRWRRGVMFASIGFHTALGLTFVAAAASTPLSESIGLANAFKRVRGWEETAEALARASAAADVEAVVFDNRNDFHQMQRYGTGIEADLYMWRRYAAPASHAEQVWPLPAGYDEPVLVASERPREIPLIGRDFREFEPAGEIVIPLGGERERVYRLFRAEGYAPVPRTDAYEAWVAEIRAGD